VKSSYQPSAISFQLFIVESLIGLGTKG
jgi:hypothetical protein